MFRSKKWLDKKESERLERSVSKVMDNVRELKSKVYDLELENSKLKWVVENPKEFNVGDVLNGSVLVSVKCTYGFGGCSGYGWYYEWVDINKIKGK